MLATKPTLSSVIIAATYTVTLIAMSNMLICFILLDLFEIMVMQCTIDEISGFKSSLSRILHGLVIIDTNFIVQPLQVLINNLRKSPLIVVKEHHSGLVILRTGRTRLKFMFKTKMFKKKNPSRHIYINFYKDQNGRANYKH